MNSKEQARFNALYRQHLTELKLQGLAPETSMLIPGQSAEFPVSSIAARIG